jgi:CheY-like chemotaxis protein/two-component sensor histidine kinase
MERQLGQMVRLVDDLMDVSRITRGNLELKKERVQLAAAVGSAVETSCPLIEQMGHELTIRLTKHPVVVNADPTRLAQVFANLLNNAAKYNDRGGHIWLTAERQGSDVVVSVKDTGIGIPPDQLTTIFDMFNQVDRSLEKAQDGLGIGLTFVRRLVEMHDGRVEARSEGIGRGAEFVVRLPVVVEASVPQREYEEPAAPKSSLRILIVDDNQDGADSLAMMLRIMKYDTATAYDGQEGVDVAERLRPDVVLLDIGLPKLNGYEACRRIRGQPWGKSMVLIALTGWGQDRDRRRSHEAGFDHHMVKPVDPDALMRLLAELQAVKK